MRNLIIHYGCRKIILCTYHLPPQLHHSPLLIPQISFTKKITLVSLLIASFQKLRWCLFLTFSLKNWWFLLLLALKLHRKDDVNYFVILFSFWACSFLVNLDHCLEELLFPFLGSSGSILFCLRLWENIYPLYFWSFLVTPFIIKIFIIVIFLFISYWNNFLELWLRRIREQIF